MNPEPSVRPDRTAARRRSLRGVVFLVASALSAAVGYSASRVDAGGGASGGHFSRSTAQLIEAELVGVSCPQLNECLAVGDYTDDETNYRPLVEAWDGSTWTLLRSPDVGYPIVHLRAVACPAKRLCIAVGEKLGSAAASEPRTLAEVWNGYSWKVMRTPATGGEFEGVSCTSTTRCVAVGETDAGSSLVERWNGSTWSVMSTPLAGGLNLDGASCQLRGPCVVVGDRTWTTRTNLFGFSKAEVLKLKVEVLELSANGWVSPRAPLLETPVEPDAASFDLGSVSCVTSFCEAVGQWVHGMVRAEVVESSNGGGWDLQRFPGAVFGKGGREFSSLSGHRQVADLPGVSCTSARFCVAVGNFDPDFSCQKAYCPVSAVWNGRHWRLTPNPAHGAILSSVSCAGDERCLAVGQVGPQAAGPGGEFVTANTLGETWNGVRWAVVPMPTP